MNCAKMFALRRHEGKIQQAKCKKQAFYMKKAHKQAHRKSEKGIEEMMAANRPFISPMPFMNLFMLDDKISHAGHHILHRQALAEGLVHPFKQVAAADRKNKLGIQVIFEKLIVEFFGNTGEY